MRFRRLYLGDMGVYRNAVMENIAEGMVVIGGLNRAGKTTLLEVFRHIPYGLTKNLRNTAVEYDIECEMENENKETVAVKLQGLREPQIRLKGHEIDIPIKQLYGNIDKFTYSQLYTITLEELKKLSAKGEEEKLQAVLLGTGIKDIVHIPRILESISNEKIKIGGKTGSPKVKQFKYFYDTILQGMQIREEALKTLESYDSLKQEEDKLIEEIAAIEQELKVWKENNGFVNIYTEEYKDISNIEQEIEFLEQQEYKFDFKILPSIEKAQVLYEEYLEAYKNNENLRENFREKLHTKNIDYKELLKCENKIKPYIKNAS